MKFEIEKIVDFYISMLIWKIIVLFLKLVFYSIELSFRKYN